MIRKAEHLQDFLLRDETPTGMVIGSIETGRWAAEDGVSHTYDKLNRIMPNLSNAWQDVTAGACIGAPCDPSVQKIGMGFTRDSSKLKQAAFETDLICYDLVLSADRAKRQWAHVIDTLRDCTKLINDDNLLCEYFRLAGHHWICSMTAPNLLPFTFTETGQLINVDCVDQLGAPIVPDSKLVVNMLKQRIEYQRLAGALGKTANTPPEIEVFTDLDTVWELCQGDSTVADHWRFERFEVGSKEYHSYGWTARVGNFMLHALLHPLRFQIAANGTTLNRVFPYLNIPATVGIKGVPNPYYINAPIGATMIWHRRMMRWLVRDTTAINPMMPFAARDFGGKWQFLMDNITCGTAVAKDAAGNNINIPIAVDNGLRNKGKFHADFSGAAEAQYPEYGEVFLHRREPPCIVGMPPCAEPPTYVEQDYDSHNEPC